MKWTNKEIILGVELLNNKKSFVEISKTLNRGYDSVFKKFKSLGYKSNYEKETTYDKIDWNSIQSFYDNGYSYDDLIHKCNLSTHSIIWAKANKKLKFRTVKEGLKLARSNGKYKESLKTGIKKYRLLCKFNFNVYHFPNKFDLSIIDQYGWYKAKNNGDNPNGVSRDHMYSVSDGFKNNIDVFYISHPANCELMVHSKNNKKKTNSSITLEELLEKIKKW